MKSYRILLSILLGILVLSSASFGQSAFRQGRWLMMGSSSASFTSYSGDLFEGKESILSLQAGAANLISREFALGGMLAFQTSDGASMIGIGPLVRFYIPGNGNVAPFLGAFFLYNSYSPKSGDSSKDMIIGLQGGAAFLVSNSVSIDLGIDVKLHNYSQGDHDSVSGTEIVIPLGITVFL